MLKVLKNPYSELDLGHLCDNFKNKAPGLGSEVVFSNYSICNLAQQFKKKCQKPRSSQCRRQCCYYPLSSFSAELRFYSDGEFPGSPVVRTRCFYCPGLGSIPDRGTKILQGAGQPRKKNFFLFR